MRIKVFLLLLLIGIALLFCAMYLITHLRSEIDKREQEIDKFSSRVDSPIPRLFPDLWKYEMTFGSNLRQYRKNPH